MSRVGRQNRKSVHGCITFRFAAQRRLLACTKPHEAAKSATSYIAMVDDTPGTSGPECNGKPRSKRAAFLRSRSNR